MEPADFCEEDSEKLGLDTGEDVEEQSGDKGGKECKKECEKTDEKVGEKVGEEKGGNGNKDEAPSKLRLVPSQIANNEPAAPWKLLEIGAGACGQVFALNGPDLVVKIPNGPAWKNSLQNDMVIHMRIEESMAQLPSDMRKPINIPEFAAWVSLDPSIVTSYSDVLHDNKRPTFGLLSERIGGVPEPLREALVDNYLPYWSKETRNQTLNDPSNKPCLVRPYLGKRDPDARNATSEFRLRNFGFLVNEMEYLELPTQQIAEVMADTLAILHHKACIDAGDVEFVLGSESKGGSVSPSSTFDYMGRPLALWLLDFNRCSQLDPYSSAESRAEQMALAFWFNSPFYPRVGSDHPADVELWQQFSDRYIQTSERLGGGEVARLFIEIIESNAAER